MIIFGYSLNEKYIYLAGGTGLLLKFGNKILNNNIPNKSRDIEKKEEIYASNVLSDISPSVILFKREEIKTYNSRLLDPIQVIIGKDSNIIRLLYTQNDCVFILHGKMIYYPGNYWKFELSFVENIKPNKIEKLDNNDEKNCILMKRITSIPYYPNVNFNKKGNNYVLAGAITSITNSDIDGDGKKGELEDIILGGLLGGLILNKLTPNVPGLYLKENTIISIQP